MQGKGRSILRACGRLVLLALHIQHGLLLIAVNRFRHGKGWFDSVRGYRIIQWWARRACRILAIQLQVKGTASIVRDTLYVSNHVSWIDIIALSSLLETKFLAKESVKHWPVIGRLAAASGTLFIKRSNHFAINRVVENIRHKLDNNHAMLIFPEGTTTDGRQVGRFHAGLFNAASHTEHFVQAIALRYQRDGHVDEFAPYIGDDNFVGHLLRISSLRETRLEVVFAAPFQALNMNRRVAAENSRTTIIGMLQSQHNVLPGCKALPAEPDQAASAPLILPDRIAG